MWESSLRSFHTGFLLSPLTFPVPGERLIPALSCCTDLLFVFTSLPGFAPQSFSSELHAVPPPKHKCVMNLLFLQTHLEALSLGSSSLVQ